MHSDHDIHASGSYDTPMGEWSSGHSGPAGLSASSVLGQSAAITSGLMSGAPAFGSIKNEGEEVKSQSVRLVNNGEAHSDGTQSLKPNEMESASSRGMEWFVGNGRSDGKIAHEDTAGKGAARNHELDFFSFS
ncbi:hypothetical protein G7046_g860 [Stylonectria norvegica]|nr:hypothetical protein G7046_g860 [Stylonectria norvegica]